MEGASAEIHEVIDPSRHIILIAPDEAAGGNFAQTIYEHLAPKGFSVATYPSEIAPRVETDEGGNSHITKDREQVSVDLANAIKRAVADNPTHEAVSLTCNTLSLEDVFVNRTLQLLEAQGLKADKDFKLVTTLQAIKDKYREENTAVPLILGTAPLSEELPKEGLKTLFSENQTETLKLTQEIIWRVKAIKQSDVSTGLKTDDVNEETVLRTKVKELIHQLKTLGITEVVMGCTELPIAFDEYADPADLEGLNRINPAVLVAERLTSTPLPSPQELAG